MKEHWAIIKYYNNYAVSWFGRVRNLKTGHLLKHQNSERGGCYAFINLHKDGLRRNVNVHILVATYFLGPQPEGTEIHHKDKNRMNPRFDNLEYLTKKAHNKIHTFMKGE